MIPDGDDGVTHVNVYSQGKTELGRWLTNFAHTPFDLPEDGHFESVEGYWYWLSCRDDRLRKLHGFDAKRIGREACQKKKLEVPDFKIRILAAIDTKLKADRRMLRVFAESTLPLAHYYVFGGQRKDAGYEWITEHLELRRSQLKKAWGLS